MGLLWIVFERVGLDRIGLDWIGPGWIGKASAGGFGEEVCTRKSLYSITFVHSTFLKFSRESE